MRRAGFKVSNAEDVKEVTNYLSKPSDWVQEQLRDPEGLPISVRLICDAHRLLLIGARGAGKRPGRTASISELGRRYTAGERRVRAATAGARAQLACGHGEVHS